MIKIPLRFALPVIFLLGLFAVSGSAAQPVNHFLVTNNDLAQEVGNSATVYSIAPGGSLTLLANLLTGSSGSSGGYFAAHRVSVLHSASADCAFISDGGSNTVAGLVPDTQTLTGTFSGSGTDTGGTNGIGLATNDIYLYAGFSGSNTIGTFSIQTGCTASFLGDLAVGGFNGGGVTGLAAYQNILVATFGDGSIESFNIAGGIPVPNGDLQNATGAMDDHFPNGVDISADGHFAVFGDASTVTTVEVSDISSGKLTPTVVHNLSGNWNSGNVTLSPDGTLLYVSNDSGGQVVAAFFNASTGAVSPGCSSPALKGFYSTFQYLGNISPAENTGTGGILYVPEFGSPSAIGIVTVQSNGSQCTLAESTLSPVSDPNSSALLSIGVYPARTY